MKHILLLGAGFTRNWGGLLANELFDSLIGMDQIRTDDYLLQLLWRFKADGGFERALSEVQALFKSDPQRYRSSLAAFQEAIAQVFARMNNAFFASNRFEFQQHIARMLRTFLLRFDRIFTLNQDVLLEHHYFPHVELGAPGRWHAAELPGLKRVPNEAEVLAPSWGKDTWLPLDEADFKIHDKFQPLFKLHGSTNWRDSEGGHFMVLGGAKQHAIQSHPLLSWYFSIFRETLLSADTRLLVIGYGFRDPHVNEVIIQAVNRSQLKFFVIDTLGSDIVRHANPSFGGAIYAPNELDDAFRNGLIGASKRSLSETFGADDVSYTELMRFFS